MHIKLMLIFSGSLQWHCMLTRYQKRTDIPTYCKIFELDSLL